MSKTIEERVVAMRFDNKQFERNAQTSISTLDKLKRALNLDGAAKSFSQVDSAAKKLDLSGISSAAETLKTRFSALEVMAVTSLANITNSAVNAGKQIVHSLTIAPIKQGFDEYELKMGSIQTMMMSTGESLESVNHYLDELNTYADKTIYSFSDMTSNIGKFTNAGVGLKDSVKAIQGVSNVAAISGANANEASRAMYNFAQALSAGSVKLIDWKSIENANMATVEFKNELIKTAVAMGTLIESEGRYISTTTDANGHVSDAFTATSLFNDSLSSQWMTTEVLVETLGRYSDETTEIGKKAFAAAQDVKTFTQLMDTLQEAVGSGWATTWEIVFGDFDEAKVLWTELSNTIGGFIDDQSKSRNEMLKIWKDLGGRDDLIESAKNSFGGLLSVIQPIQEAFREIFPPITAQRLADITSNLKEFTSHLKLSSATSSNLKSTFKGLFAILDIVGQAFSAVFHAAKPLLGIFGNLSGGVLGVTGSWGEWLVNLDESIRKNDTFGKAIQKVIDLVKGAKTAVDEFVQNVKDKFNLPTLDEMKVSVKDFVKSLKENFKLPGFESFHSALEKAHKNLSSLSNIARSVKNAVANVFKSIGKAAADFDIAHAFQSILGGITTFIDGIAKIVSGLIKDVFTNIGQADFGGLFQLAGAFATGGIGIGIKKFFDSMSDAFGGVDDLFDSADGMLKKVTGILDGVKDCFKAYQTELKASALLKIAGAIGILALSLTAIAGIDAEKLNGALGAITILFTDLMASMAIFSKISGEMKGAAKTTTLMLGLAVSIRILVSALKSVAELEWEDIGKGLLGVTVLMGEMVAALKLLGSDGKKVGKGATNVLIFAAAIKVLASACKDLGQLSWDELGKGLLGVGVLLGEIDIFLNTAKFSGKTITTATGIVILSAAIKILASACKDFGQMSWEGIAKGLGGIGVLLAEITAFTKLNGSAKGMVSTGVSLIAIGAAMKIFASAVSDFGQMSWEQIGKGLAAMGGALAEVAIAVNVMPKNMLSVGAGLVVVGVALEIISHVLGKMGGMSWEEIAKGLVVIGGALAELSIALNLMKGTLAGSAALLVASAAIAVLTPSLAILGAMSWEAIAKGLVTIAGAFTIMGVAGAVLGPLTPTILALSGAFALFGVGVAAIGVGLVAAGAGLSAIAVGLTALAAATAADVGAIVASLSLIVTGIADLIPVVIGKIGEGIVEFGKAIALGAPSLGEAAKAIILTLVDVLVECVPQIADGALQLIDGVLAALVQYTPSIVNSLFQFLILLLDGVADNLPTLIQSAMNVIMAFFQGVVDALSGLDVDTLIKGVAGVGIMSAMMFALSAVASLVPGALIGVAGMAAVIAEMALLLAAIGGLAQIPGLNWLITEGGNLLQNVGTAIGQFIGGIAGGFMTGVSSQFPQIATDLSNFMTNLQPFIDGARGIDSSMMAGVGALAGVILALTAADILNGIASWITGGSSLSDFAEQLVPFGEAIAAFSDVVDGKINEGAVSAAANAGAILAELAGNLPNSGGVLGWIMGENNLDDFASRLEPFADAIVTFSSKVDGKVSESAVQAAANAGATLAALASDLPNTGGVLGWLVGENNIDDFASRLVPFGEAIAEFSSAVNGKVSESAVQAAANAGATLTALAKDIPNSGGVLGWIMGENDIDAFGSQLISFGENFAAYSDKMSSVDSNIVTATTNAAKALVSLSNSLPEKGGWFSGDMSLSDFGSDISLFGSFFAGFYSSISGIDPSTLSAVIAEFEKLVSLANGASSVDFTGMSTFGQSLTNLGQAGVNGFIKAFTDAMPRVNVQGAALITNAKNGVQTGVSGFYSLGINAGQGFINGLYAMNGPAWSAGWSIGNAALMAAKAALDSHSPSREFIYLGQHTGEGYVIGVNNSIGSVKNATSAMMNQSIATAKKGIDTFEDWLDERKYYNEISIKEELAGWEQLQKQYKEGSEERKKIDREVFRCQNELVKATYQFSVDWIEKEKYYKRLSLEDELAAWKRVQSRYMAGSEERKQADREVFRVENELEDERYQKRLDHIDNEVFYGRMSVQEELAALEELQKQYEVGSEKYLEIDKMIYSKRKEVVKDFYDTLNDYISNERTFGRMGDIGELGTMLAYIDQLEEGSDEWKKAMTSVYTLVISIGEAQLQYEKDVAAAEADHAEKRLQLEQEYADYVKEVNQQLEADIESLNKKYEDAIQSRADSLYRSYGLFDEVKQKDDVSGDTLINNLKGQVAEFDEWQAMLKSLAAKGVSGELLEELQEMGPSSIANVRALNGMTSTQLTQYVNLWSTKHRQAKDQATSELEGMRVETQKQIAQLKVDAANDLEEYKKVWQTKMSELDESLQKTLKDLETDFHKSIGLISKYTQEELNTMVGNVSQLLGEKGFNIGTNLLQGIIKGFEEEKPNLINASKAVAANIVDPIEGELDIHSPSRVTYQLAVFAVRGFVNALNDMCPSVYDASNNLAEASSEGIGKAIQYMMRLLDGDIETQPTIRPVLDLSDVSSAAAKLDNLLYAERTARLASDLELSMNRKSPATGRIVIDNGDVVEAIQDLRRDMAAMSDAVTHMQVVLDTGVLAGEMTGPLDRNLGRRQIYRGRGN